MTKNIIKIAVIFILGLAGGIFVTQIIWSHYLNGQASIPLSINETKEVIIQENTALQEAVKKIEKAVVGIRVKTKEGGDISGSGVVVTSDGLIITLAELVPKAGDFVFFVDAKTPNWQVLKRDAKNNLALIKVDEQNLTTVGFADFGELKLGQRVFLAGIIFQKEGSLKMVNEGIVKFFTQDYIRTNIFEKSTLKGSPLFNIKGELLGLNTIDSEGKITTIPITKIREFIGL